MKADLTSQEVKELVEGAQKFLAPMEDPRDEERLTPTPKQTGIDYGTDTQ